MRTLLPILSALLATVAAYAQTESPNILVFVADDVSWRDIGCLGNDAVQTPNLDALAENGLICSRAFLTTPQCSPSRISVLTGKYPHATGAEDLHTPLPEGETFVTTCLRDQGYFTGHMRKTHYGPNGNNQFDWYDRGVNKFAEFLDAGGDRPFFMWVGFRDAHRPYQDNTIETPHDPAAVKVPPYLVDDAATRRDLAQYYDEIARMDENIGNFIRILNKRGMFDNTLIVFFGDNGMPFPRAKGTLYDSGIGTPFIVSWPKQIPQGSKHDGLVSVIDLAPTFLEAAGLDPSAVAPEMQGHSMLNRLRDPSLPGRDYVFAERNWHNCDEHMRSVRSARYKLIRNAYLEWPHGSPSDLGASPSFKSLFERKKLGTLTAAQAQLFQVPRPRVELYDVELDPWETRNIADTDSGREIVQRLEAVMDEWRAATGDFPATVRRRADNTDRYTGMKFSDRIAPMTDDPASWPER